jgi:hypothetical protein
MGLKEAKDFVEGGMDSPEKVAALPRLSGGGAAKSSDASCFPAEALVATPLGLRTIASLCPGDEVLSYSAAQGLTRERVTRLLCHGAASLWVTELGTGAELVSTGNHRMLTARGWVRVDSLRRGDRLTVDGGFVSVLRDPRSSGRRAPVFNLYTTGPHNFVVDGCVAHNFTTMPLLRTLMHRVFVDPFFGAGRGHKASLDLLEGIDAARQ